MPIIAAIGFLFYEMGIGWFSVGAAIFITWLAFGLQN